MIDSAAAPGDHSVMLRALATAALVIGLASGLRAQEPTVLHIRVTLADEGGRPRPVARHALLISTIPAAATPRRTITAADGTVDVSLRPGQYIVESDRPAAMRGRSYQWMQAVEITGGREATLELDSANAIVEAASTAAPVEAVAEPPAASTLTRWMPSVVGLWTARTHASGFLVDNRGLVVTNQRAIGDATSVEVQLTPAIKLTGRVVVSDPERDVAVVWVDPSAVASLTPVPLECDSTGSAPLLADQELSAIEVPLRGPAGVASDLYISPDATGGPVFAANGALVGLTSAPDAARGRSIGTARVVGIDAVCPAVASARTKLTGPPPASARLPVESDRAISATALDSLSRNSAFTLNPYRLSTSDFDIAFITPVLLARAASRQEWMTDREDRSGAGAVTDFGDWSEYVAGHPQVLLIRATPRIVEGFWMKVARSAAETQGVSMPPIKRMRPGFAHMRLLCGEKEVTPVHPFKVRRRLSETEGIDEGLYAFDPSAIGPECGTVKLELFSAKAPDQADVRVVEPAIVRRVAQDFSALFDDRRAEPAPR